MHCHGYMLKVLNGFFENKGSKDKQIKTQSYIYMGDRVDCFCIKRVLGHSHIMYL